MRHGLITALGAGIVLAVAGTSAQALPVAPAPDAAPLVQQAAQGCGPGFFRGPRGFCRPMVRRGFYRGPRCFVRRTPFGPRRVCR